MTLAHMLLPTISLVLLLGLAYYFGQEAGIERVRRQIREDAERDHLRRFASELAHLRESAGVER